MNKYSLVVAAIALGVAASSCSHVHNVVGKIPFIGKTETQQPTTQPVETQPTVSTSTDTTSVPAIKIQPVDPAVTLPAPVISVPDTAVADPDLPALSVHKTTTMDSPLARNLGGEWTIVKVGETNIDRDDDRPYIIFEPTTGCIYAYNGCNTLNGFYSVAEGDMVSFSNLLSTLRMCPDSTLDSQINGVIQEGTPIKAFLKEVGTETFVEFLSNTGESLMRLRRGNLRYLNGQWDVESIAAMPKLETPANIFFDIAELKLHGNTGCNIVNGEIYMDHRRPNAIDFSKMITTRIACPFEAQQTAMLVALEETVSAISDGTERVLLLNADGKTVMTLRKASQVYED